MEDERVEGEGSGLGWRLREWEGEEQDEGGRRGWRRKGGGCPCPGGALVKKNACVNIIVLFYSNRRKYTVA